MKTRIFCLFFSLMLLFSCRDEDAQRQAALKDAQKKEQIFTNINNGWNFTPPSLNPQTQGMLNNWSELRLFLQALTQKPKSSIGAFQKKSKELSTKAKDLNNNIPQAFNKPEVKSRISVLTTKINSINLYINLQEIPDQKVVGLVRDVNEELLALYRQMDEIVRKSNIPKEEGESDMLRMLDTARAIPNTKPMVPTGIPNAAKTHKP
ncbi:hypothetical protein [Flavobacterium sp.]|uniref:hypothetical protein n=1 Tax=Flavobacterium sp. TaxID=239 RepID=UPI0039E4CCB1